LLAAKVISSVDRKPLEVFPGTFDFILKTPNMRSK
jgi:hypothetical protein